MDFLKTTSRIVAPSLNKKSPKSRRSLQFETLESRELLAVSLLGAPISGYAAQGTETEIRFDLSTNADGYAKVDFNVRAGSGLNPSELSLYNHTTGQTVVLSNVTDGSTSSSASGLLSAGTYSVYVGADSGQGAFTIDILHDNTYTNTLGSALPILVEAALAQRQTGWASHVSYYNKLLSQFGYGSNALNGKPVQELFPEVDVNGDGVVTSTDYDLSLQLISGIVVTPSIKTTPTVVIPDVTAPTITAALKNDTGTVGDKITVDTTIVGRVTDASGIQSAQYRIDKGSWVSLTLDSKGNYTIPHQNVAAGTHTVTIRATDTFGTAATATTTFVYASSTAPGGSNGSTISDSGTGKVSLGSAYTVSKINGSAVSAGTKITLADNRGTVTVNTDGSLSFVPGSYYDRLAQGEKGTQEITVVSKDEHGREYNTTLSFTVTGKNDLPVLSSSSKPTKTVKEGSTGTIAASTILSRWTDVDNGAVMSITQLGVYSVSSSNPALSSTYTATEIAKYISIDSGGVKLDASSDFFKALGNGDSLTITVSYKMSDGIGVSTQSAYLTFTVTGKNNLPVLGSTNKPTKTVKEGSTGTISNSTILALWSDADQGASLSVTQAAVSSVSCSNTALASTFTANKLAASLSTDSTGVKFDASADLFKALGAGETLTITVSYKMSDGIGVSTQTGYLTFTVTGKDDPSKLSVTNSTFNVISNDLKNPLKAIDAGFSVTDPDFKDATGFVYSVKSVSDSTVGLIAGFNASTGTFGVDTSKLANRNSASVLTVVVSVKSLSGGTVEQTLTINLNPLNKPAVPALTLSTTETDSVSGNVSPTVAGSGYTISGLKLSSGALPSGASLNELASIDASGNFRFDPGSHYTYLKSGEKVELVFQYTLTDTQYGLTETGTIAITITGVATPAVAPSTDPIGSSGKYRSQENNGNAPSVSVPKNDLLADWTLPESASAYKIVPGSANFSSWSDGTTNPLGSNNFGTVSVDAAGNLLFIPSVGLYDVLGEDQWIEFTIDYGVQNNAGGQVVSGGRVLIRIYGQNTAPELSLKENSFKIASNSNSPVVMNPGCTAKDVDLNNMSFSYDIDQNAKKAGFTVDAKTGVISIAPEDVAKLTGTRLITLTVTDSQGAKASCPPITVEVYSEANPTVSDVKIGLDENSADFKNLSDAVTKKDGHGYTINDIRYVGANEPLPGTVDPSGLFNFDGNIFTFSTDGQFDYLSAGESLTLIFEFTVTDNGFSNCSTTRQIKVVISGVNDAPTHTTGNALTADASKSNVLDWQSYFSDVDRKDVLSISKINGQSLTGGSATVENLGTFHYNETTGELSFTPDAKFDTLAEGERSGTLPPLTLTVVDDKGDFADGVLGLEIIGTNKAPEIANGEYKTLAGVPVSIPITDFVTDKNTGDTHRIVSVTINGKTYDFQDEMTATLPTGTTITLNDERTMLTVDASKRDSHPDGGKPETIEMSVVVTDEKQFNRLSEPGLLTVVIGVTAPKVDDLTLTPVNENSTTAPVEVDLSKQITDTNVPIRENDTRWYVISHFKLTAMFGDRELTTEEYHDISEFWNYSDGKLTFDAPNGYFNFLAAGETLTLTFSYTVTDDILTDENDNTLSADGKITLEIKGVNTDPVVVSGETEYSLTNSGMASDISIPLGTYTYTDDDRRDGEVYQWSIANLSDPALGDFVGIDAVGNLSLDNTFAPALTPGDSITFTFEVKIQDGNGGTGTRTVTVTLYGKKEQIVAVDDFDLTEGDTSRTNPISVTDPAEDFMDKRTGDAWYEEPEIVSIDVPTKYAEKFTPEELAQLFTVVGDPSTGYSVVFNAASDRFDFLNKDEKLSLTINLLVVDGTYGVQTTTAISCTITGTGDLHTVNLLTGNSFEFWANDSTVVKKNFAEFDVVDNDDGETHTFTLDVLPDGLQPGDITVDPSTGLITVWREGFLNLTQDTTYILVINVVGNNDGLSVPVTVELVVKVADAPAVDPITVTVDETADADAGIVVKDPTDKAQREENWYTISGPTYVTHHGTLPANGTLPTGYDVKIENGRFVFETKGVFDYLGSDESLTFVYEFTVVDTRYGTATTETATVTITGVNTPPEGVDAIEFDAGTVGDDAIKLGKLEDMVVDTDLNDTHTLVSIDGVAVTPDCWISVPGKGQFLYENDELWYKPQPGEGDTTGGLESLSCGEPTALVFEFVVKDDSGEANAEGTGTLTIDVRGTNKAPEMNGNRFDMVEGNTITYKASGLATDQNTGDTLRIYSVKDQVVQAGDVIYLEGNMKVTIGPDRLTITVDTSEMNLKDGEIWPGGFYLVIEDGTGTGNDKTYRTWTPVVVTGIDNAPDLPETQEFGFSMDGKKTSDNHTVGSIYLADPDTPRGDYKITYDGNLTVRESTIDVTGLETEFAVRNNGKITLYDAPDLAEGQSVTYEFKVKVTCDSDPEFEQYVTVIVKLSKMKTPGVSVSDDGVTGIPDTDVGPVEFDVTVTDRNGDRTTEWYSYTNVRFVQGHCSWNDEMLSTLPGAASFGFYENTDRFYFDPAGAFDFLGDGESIELTFEFTVRDVENGVEHTEKIMITVNGVNGEPSAFDHTAPFHVSADTAEGIKFWLSDLASDSDVRDTLSFDTVNEQPIALGDEIDVLDEKGNVMGTVCWRRDTEKGDYLLFKPSGSSEEIRYELLKAGSFTFTVTDGISPSDEATIDFQVRGTNKTPEFTKTKDSVKENETLEITASDIATDKNDGDTPTIVGVQVGDKLYEINAENPQDIVITLESGSVLTLRANGTLLFDPTGRNVNLQVDVSAEESFTIILSDDSGANTASARAEAEFTVEVVGVNDAPVDVQPEKTDVSGKLGSTVRVNLNEMFRDADGDTLTFSIKENSNSPAFLDHYYIDRANGELVLVFMPVNDYANDFDFTPQTLTIIADDETDTTEKTLTIRAEEQYTVKLEITTSEQQVAVGDSYTVEVSAHDLLNTLLQKESASNGLIDISFALYYNKELCDVSGLPTDMFREGGCIVFSTKLDLGNFDATLLSFTVTAKGIEGKTETAAFWFDNVNVIRNEESAVVDASQIELGSVSVQHIGVEIAGTNFVVGFSAPSIGTAFATLQSVFGWTSGDELVWGDRGETDTAILDEAFEDADFLDETGFAAVLFTEGTELALDMEIEMTA